MSKRKPLSPSLIVTTYNWPEALEKVFESISCQRLPPFEVVIADDGSGPPTKAVIDAFRARAPFPVKHVWQEDNGFRASAIHNKAFLACTGDYIVQIDGDILIHSDFIADHVAAAAPGCFIVGGRTNLTEEQTRSVMAGTPVASLPGFSWGRKLKMRHIPWLATLHYGYQSGNFLKGIGANMSFWAEDLHAVNGYDEDYEGWGWEDSDFIYRMMSLGLKKRYLRYAAISWHLWHPSRREADVFERNRMIMEKNKTGSIACKNGMVKLIDN